MHHDLMQKPDDHEAKMARADLFKLAQYSFKLFKMINENQELEGWVQAKITKAADYIASVYHYMEYEMKISEYGDAIENADMYSESVRRAFQQKLVEAKEMAAKAKAKVKKKEEELDEGMAPMEPDGSTAPPPKGPDGKYPIIVAGPDKGLRWGDRNPRTGRPAVGPTNPALAQPAPKPGAVREGAKSKKGDGNLANNAKPYDKVTKGDVIAGRLGKDEMGGKKVKEEADRPAAKKKETTWTDKSGKKHPAMSVQGSKSVAADKEADKERKASDKVKEAVGKCNHTPKGEKCPVHGLKECGGMYEASHQEKTTMKHVKNPTAGEKKAAKDIKAGVAGYKDRADMLKSAEKDGRLKEGSTGDYSAKKAAAGKDIGKPGKNFAKIAKSAGKAYGSKERGEKVAGAVLAKLRAKG